MDDEGGEESELGVQPFEVLLAALIAKDFLPASYSDNKTRTNAVRAVALDWLDWAVCESDRGRELAQAKAQAALNRKGDGQVSLP